MRSIVLLASLLLACGSDSVPTDGGAAGSTTNGSTTLDSSTTSTSTSTSGADETSQTSVAFVGDPDLGQGDECDFFIQDCPAGFKCMPYANGGTAFNALGCFPVVDDPAEPGEPCTAEGSPTSGFDTCNLGSICWAVEPDTHEGTCVAFCMGEPNESYCEDPDAFCEVPGDGAYFVCIPRCHPLEDDCPDGQGCYPSLQEFICTSDGSGEMGGAGAPCEYVSSCDPTTFCANAELVPDCTGSLSCCSSFCTIGDDSPCLPGQTCQPWYEPGDAPPGYDDLGACALP